MINAKGEIKLNYTEEFQIACKINNLTFEQLIQYFIDHVSFYAFIGGDTDAIYLWATTVCIECKDDLERTVKIVTDPEIRDLSLKYIRKLTALTHESDFSKRKKAAQSLLIMRDWAVEMSPLTDYQAEVYTTEGLTFQLNFNFNLLCRMNGIDVEELLQYFVAHISLARDRAMNLLHVIKTDPSTAVLLLMVSGHELIKNRVLPKQEVYKKYGLKLLTLDQQQKEENNLQKRILNYTRFYQEWYTALQLNLN